MDRWPEGEESRLPDSGKDQNVQDNKTPGIQELLSALDESPAMPERLGPYRILKRLGEGGMGTVYLADQEEPVKRQVAIKLIDAVQRSRRRRFAAECQALARLSHPNVASLYEVGVAEDGCPFLVMEWVEGTSIKTWCDERKLGLTARIRLFVQACAGIRHAHEKGILHRDIKPSNVMVSEVDGEAVAKVIDFSIARALDDDEPLHEGTHLTEHQFVGSPAYVSPEAAGVVGDGVDTRSDVYSLGLLLYELLTGTLPFDEIGESLPKVLRRLETWDPTLPSLRVDQLGEADRQHIARLRNLEPRALGRRLSGDLDAIVRKAISRDPARRYSSPADLAADLRRFLNAEPIAARPASAPYLFGRFLRRNLGKVTAVALLILALAVGFVTTSTAARQARDEAQKAREALAEAEQVSRFLVDLFEVADPEKQSNEPVSALELLDRGAENLRQEFAEQPLIQARFLQTIGVIYTKLARFEPAERLVAEALAIRQGRLPEDDPETIESLNQLGVIYRRMGRLDEAEPRLVRVLELRRGLAEPIPLDVALAENNLGNLWWSQGRYEEAERSHRRALEIRQAELPSGHPDLAESYNNLGVALKDQERFEDAVALLQLAVDQFTAAMGERHPRLGAALSNLADAESRTGRHDAAERHFVQGLEIWEEAYGLAHPRTILLRTQRARHYWRSEQWPEALREWQTVERLQRERLGDASPRLETSLLAVAKVFEQLDQPDQAELYRQRALGIRDRVDAADD